VTFHSSRNEAQTQLDELGKSQYVTVNTDRQLKVAELRVALTQAEAHHELATALGNVAKAIGVLRR
jgi:hypothetical protein